ncbi:hypothetical protein K443DRAFT_599789 [Laccaria amethystina LaAM-08-1]|uniref:Uncharacterized protein n=1 Tax=Laccaria amethystina LaAM-08-1 TaxID=1095629 RepID=A0A0C9WQJ9_9AGAR|nr:hypothetical protein K443DRAFT_599789 [Laccaria amethystina LaAM-08-1]
MILSSTPNTLEASAACSNRGRPPRSRGKKDSYLLPKPPSPDFYILYQTHFTCTTLIFDKNHLLKRCESGQRVPMSSSRTSSVPCTGIAYRRGSPSQAMCTLPSMTLKSQASSCLLLQTV